MLATRIICSIIPLGLGAGMAIIAFRAITNGYVTPFRMARWNKPDEVYRKNSPFEFWFWIVGYFVFCAGAIIVSILGLLGNIKLR